MNLTEFGRLFDCSVPEILDKLRNDKDDFWRWWWTQFASEQMGVHHADLRRTISSFARLLSGLDVRPLLQEIDGKPQNWLVDTSRQKRISVQQNTDSIYLRRAALVRPAGADGINDVHESAATDLARDYPRLMGFLEKFAETYARGTLSRVMIVRLAAKKDVGRHWDCGYYYLCRDRYHLVLRSTGSEMECAGARCSWNVGELWWFNNNLWHSSHHASDDWRMHVIFDVLPFRNVALVEQFKRHTEYYRSREHAETVQAIAS
jgi:hypothetical protein